MQLADLRRHGPCLGQGPRRLTPQLMRDVRRLYRKNRMRQCIFCGQRANSTEDVWPRWLTKQFKGENPSEVQAERKGIKLPSWKLYQPELLLHRVCQSCNNEWMSDLEVKAKKEIQPTLTGAACNISYQDQSIVALWSMKTAMLLDALDNVEDQMYTQTEREQLRSLSNIPYRTSIWLAGYSGSPLFMSSKTIHHGSITGVTFTMVFASLVVQVFTIKLPEYVNNDITVDVRRGPWNRATFKIWPPQTVAIQWPAEIIFNSEIELNSFAQRFLSANDDDNEIEKMVV